MDEQKLNFYLNELNYSNNNLTATNNNFNFELNESELNNNNSFNDKNLDGLDLNGLIDEDEINELNKIVQELDYLIKESPPEIVNNNDYNSTDSTDTCFVSRDYNDKLLVEEIQSIHAQSQAVELEFIDKIFLNNSDPVMF